MKGFRYLAIAAMMALPLLLTSGSASAAPSTAKAPPAATAGVLQPALSPASSAARYITTQAAAYIETVGYLSDGRQQAFRSVAGATWIQSSWQVGSPTGPWTIWTPFPYPPTSAGVSSLHAGIQNNITYLYVYTNGGGNWETHKLSTDPNDGWTSYYGA
jgi:hypothetical protein